MHEVRKAKLLEYDYKIESVETLIDHIKRTAKDKFGKFEMQLNKNGYFIEDIPSMDEQDLRAMKEVIGDICKNLSIKL